MDDFLAIAFLARSVNDTAAMSFKTGTLFIAIAILLVKIAQN